MTQDLAVHSTASAGHNDYACSLINEVDLGIMSKIFASKLSDILAETIERLLSPVAEIEIIKRKIYLSEREVSIFFSIAPATLKTDRCRGAGPRYMKDGRKILYSMNDLVDYYERRIVRARG